MAVTPERLKELWSLLLEDPKILTDAQIQEIIEASKELNDKLFWTHTGFPSRYEAILRYRRRKQELEQLPTAQLKEMDSKMHQRRSAIIAADTHDELSDSFYESPPIDSDEHIVYEILKEREKEIQPVPPT